MSDPTREALAPARTGGVRRLTFDNGRHEDYQTIFVQHPAGEWDRILIARDDGTIATYLADLINAAALSTTPAPLDDLLDAITAETTLPPKPTQYRRGWADAHARIAALIRVQSKP